MSLSSDSLNVLTYKGDIADKDCIKEFEVGDHLGLSRWPSVVMRVLGNEGGDRRVGIQMRASQDNALLQALKEEEGTTSQEMQVASQAGKTFLLRDS